VTIINLYNFTEEFVWCFANWHTTTFELISSVASVLPGTLVTVLVNRIRKDRFITYIFFAKRVSIPLKLSIINDNNRVLGCTDLEINKTFSLVLENLLNRLYYSFRNSVIMETEHTC